MRKLGQENFYMEIIEECDKTKLDEREIFWIKYYNSYENGYNSTEGGQKNTSGENNGRALLTKQDIIQIREMYNNHIKFKEAYEKYKNKITKRGFQKVWYFENWGDILAIYNTEENKKWHSTISKANPSDVARNNKRAFTEEEVKEMRMMFESGLSIQEIWKSYYSQYAKSTIRNIITRKTYKDIH